MFRLLVIAVVLLTSISVSGCSPASGAVSPESAAEQAFAQGSREQLNMRNKSIQVSGTYNTPRGVVVLYNTSKNNDGQSQSIGFGYIFTVRQQDRWFPIGASININDVDPEDDVVAYSFGVLPLLRREDTSDQEMVVYGQSLQKDVHIVEAELSTNQVIQTTVTSSMFAIVAPNGTAICGLRVLDAHGQVLKSVNILELDNNRLLPDVQARVTKCSV